MTGKSGARTPVPYGSWASPISPEDLVKGAVGLHEVQADGDDLWWDEGRPEEGGRIQLVRNGEDVLPDGFAARTRVHEYGGGAWRAHGGVLFFANWADQRLHRLDPGGEPVPLTPDGCRYADLDVAPDGSYLVAVREDHRGDGEAINEIVRIDTSTGEERVLVSGPDFVASPRIDPATLCLAWTQWDHPDMPWDAAEVWAGDADAGEAERIAGGRGEWASLPTWADDGSLWFTSDREGFARVHRWMGGDEIEVLDDLPNADVATPSWVFRMARFVPDVALAYSQDGVDRLDGIDSPYTAWSSVVPSPDGIAAVAAGFSQEPAILAGPPHDLQVIRPPRDLGLRGEQISQPESIEFPSAGGRTAYALYYPPTNPDLAAPDGEKPPLLVDIHGGPTSAARSQFQLGVQFWTSRGFAVVDVNYGGSTGYGRRFRNLLRGQWGVVDVEDCVAAARHLADRGDVDGDRLAIRGGSAGGFTTLAALAFHDTFAAGVSKYGVADLAVLAQETHKFESRYLDSLIGPWPEAEAVYRERSPLFHADDIRVPLLVLQGLEDEVVPPNQSELIVEALQRNGIPVTYLAFEGEQHGFRKAETIIAATQAELAFYGEVFGFTPA